MKKKKIFALLLCAALLTGTVGAAFTPQPKPQLENSVVWGAVESIEGATIHVKNSAQSALSDVIIHMADNAPLIDAVTGTAVALSSIKVGQSVSVTIAPAIATSLPPQATGLALITNIPADFKTPEYVTIDTLLPTAEGVMAEFITADGNLQAKITKDTSLQRYVKHGEVATADIPTTAELKPGTTAFVWYGPSTKSIPAQASLTKCVLVPSTYAGFASISSTGISLNDASIALTDSQMPTQNTDGTVLIALRPVAEAAGWQLTWAGKDQPITLTKDQNTLSLSLGSSEVMVGADTQYLPQDTQIHGGTTFVDSNFLMYFLNIYTTLG